MHDGSLCFPLRKPWLVEDVRSALLPASVGQPKVKRETEYWQTNMLGVLTRYTCSM